MSGKNSEGYSDPTASIAISRATRKENKMDTARPGEIWIVQSTQGESENCVGYKKTITDAEYDAVRQAIADALGIVLAELVEIDTSEIDTSESWKLRDKIHSLEISLARCEGERDVYKELFTGGCNE